MILKITMQIVSKISELHTNNFNERLSSECRLGLGINYSQILVCGLRESTARGQ